MSSFPANIKKKLADTPFPFQSRIESIQKPKTLEICFLEPQSGQKFASIMLEIWKAQLATFEEFFDFLKPDLPRFTVTDLFVRLDLRHSGYAFFILKSMATILNTGSFGLFHINANFARIKDDRRLLR